MGLDSHVWMFKGAEGGNWIKRFEPEPPVPTAPRAATLPGPLVPPPTSRSGSSQGAKSARGSDDDDERNVKRARQV